MKRKDFLAAGVVGALAATRPREWTGREPDGRAAPRRPERDVPAPTRPPTPQEVRAHFPRLESEVFLNGAGGTPLSTFTEEAIDRYLDVIRYGNSGERAEWWGGVYGSVRSRFAELIGARPNEVGFAESTKAGEQLVLDGLPALRDGGGIVTNELHFQGSLHNLEGRRRAGHSVAVVRGDGRGIPVERMIDAIDDRTALVTVSLVSNVTGHIEPMAELSAAAHRHGALVFADIIQAAGIVPIDVEAMGIDVAACSSYKWLYGIHGAGFLYVAERHQGATLPDTIWPGGSRRLYPPFAEDGTPGELSFDPRSTADRYRPGHVNYLGYAAVDAGLRFVEQVGVTRMQRHTADLNRRIADALDPDRFEVLSPHLDRSPILSLAAEDLAGVRSRLFDTNIVVSTGGDRHDLIRISPAVYNNESDVDRLVEVLNG